MLFLAFPIIFACSHVLVSSENVILEKNIDTAAIGSKLRSILHEAGVTRANTNKSQVVVPPNYMIALYHQYTEDNLLSNPNSMSASSTSVRCILGSVKRKSINFNLSSVLLKDEISHAEVHIFRRKLYHGKLPRIKFFLSQHRTRNFLPKKVASGITQLFPSTGWQTLNIDEATTDAFRKWKELILKAEGLLPEFGEGKRPKTKYHSLSMEDVIRVAYKPFLVLFSEESRSDPKRVSKEALVHGYDTKGRESGEREWGADYEPDLEMDNSLRPLNQMDWGLKGINEAQSMGPAQVASQALETLSRTQLMKASAQNKPPISHHQVGARKFRSFGKTEAGWSRSRVETRDKPQVRLGSKQSGARNKRRSKKKFRGRKLRPAAEVEDTEGGDEDLAHNSLCTLHHLSLPLDFSDTIIAPMTFPLNYCKGYCSNPKSREQEQISVMSEFRFVEQLFPHVSSPCCVPAEMTRVSVLFVDKYNNIVLKSYANATIKSCKSN